MYIVSKDDWILLASTQIIIIKQLIGIVIHETICNGRDDSGGRAAAFQVLIHAESN